MKKENSRPIAKRLEAGCCSSAAVQRAARQKKESARGNLNPLEGQQPFRLNPNGVGDRTLTLRLLLIGEDVVNFDITVGGPAGRGRLVYNIAYSCCSCNLNEFLLGKGHIYLYQHIISPHKNVIWIKPAQPIGCDKILAHCSTK